jgi:hypothetical protein
LDRWAGSAGAVRVPPGGAKKSQGIKGPAPNGSTLCSLAFAPQTENRSIRSKGFTMPRPSTPKTKAIATGRVLHDPKRLRDREESPSQRAARDSSGVDDSAQKTAWNTFRDQLPWLNRSHRSLTEIAATNLKLPSHTPTLRKADSCLGHPLISWLLT